MGLTTDFIKIGQSGPTVDGRNLEAQWLQEAAETYDPKTYTALIWPDHIRWFGNYGKVIGLEARQDGETIGLYAKLEPNARLLQSNRDGQRLFTSMELCPNFAESGKFYLEGLGVTDEPASLGTGELKFSKRKQEPENKILCGVELGRMEEEEIGEEEAATLRKKLFHLFGIDSKSAAPVAEPETDEENEVEKEQYAALDKKLGDLTAQVTELGEKFAAQGKGEAPEPEAPKPEEGQADDASKEIYAKLDTLTDSITKLSKRMEQARPGTPAPEIPSPADSVGDVM